jgi:molybdate transport system substrate-binding protein
MSGRRWFACFTFLAALVGSSMAALGSDAITVAVAANFARPLNEIKQLYEQSTNTSVVVTVAASGALAAQLSNGAPYDVFLSADSDRPTQLHVKNHCFEPFLYARGRAVFWSMNDAVRDISSWAVAARHGTMKRIAIANPKVAPYGAVVSPLLAHVFPEGMRSKLIFGRNVAHAFQLAQSGIVDGAFTSMSFAVSPEGTTGRFWEIEYAEAVFQWGCVGTATDNLKAAKEFVRLLQSDAVQDLIQTYGYN